MGVRATTPTIAYAEALATPYAVFQNENQFTKEHKLCGRVKSFDDTEAKQMTD